MTTPVSLWEGKPLTEFSKEELIDIIEYLGGTLRQERIMSTRELRNLTMIRQKRAGTYLTGARP